MKKIFAALSVGMILSFSVISAGAVNSPNESGIAPGDDTSSSGTSSSTSSAKSNTSTSPKTGVASTALILAGMSAVACGGVAVTAKKRIEK